MRKKEHRNWLWLGSPRPAELKEGCNIRNGSRGKYKAVGIWQANVTHMWRGSLSSIFLDGDLFVALPGQSVDVQLAECARQNQCTSNKNSSVRKIQRDAGTSPENRMFSVVRVTPSPQTTPASAGISSTYWVPTNPPASLLDFSPREMQVTVAKAWLRALLYVSSWENQESGWCLENSLTGGTHATFRHQ